jgi:hypothetical protein
MLTAEEPKLPVEENKNEKSIEKTAENEVKQTGNNENKAISIDKVKEEIAETKQEIEKLESDNHKESDDNDDDDIVIPPPPEFSVPLFTKYIHGRQRSISISSELSNDSYLYEETNVTVDSSGENDSVINADNESITNTEISTDIQSPIHAKVEIQKNEDDDRDDDTVKDFPRDIEIKVPVLAEDIIAAQTQEKPVVEEKKSELSISTDESHLNVNNHVPPPRSSASLSASVTRQEGIEDESNTQNESAIKKAQETQEEVKKPEEGVEKRKRAKSFKEYFFSSASSTTSNASTSTVASSSTADREKPKKVSSGTSLMSYVGSFLKKKNTYFDTDEEFWDAFLKEYKKDAELDVNSQSTDGSNKFGDLLERVQRGVPAEHRGEIWLSISDSLDAHLDVLYWQLLNEHCPYERAINQDLGRTFPEIPMFKTDEVRKQLYNIMKAYSIYDSEVGYCQGLSFIAGLFIMNGIKEDLVFTIFVRLMESYNLRTLFTPKMPGLMLLIYQFNAIFQTYIPALYFHFYRYNLSPMMYASQWFLTLFSYSFNVDLVFRIVDMILVEGPISVLLRFALVILKRHEDELLSIEKFDSLMDFLKSDKFTQVADVEQMIKEVIDLKRVVSDNRLDQLKHEHLEDIKKREPAQREMEQLRETLKLLRKENKEQANKINEDKKIQQALTDEIVLLKQLVKELQEDNEAVKMQVKDLRTILSQEEKIKDDDRLLSLQEELQFLKDKLRATQVELCQSRMQYNELETAYQLEQERWKKSKRRLSRKIQLNENKSNRTSLMIDPPSTPATPTSMKPIELPSIRE